MNENYYIYYIVPGNNFVTEKEKQTSNNSENLSAGTELISRILTNYFPLLFLLLLIFIIYKMSK